MLFVLPIPEETAHIFFYTGYPARQLAKNSPMCLPVEILRTQGLLSVL